MWKILIQLSCNRTRSSVYSHHLYYSFYRLGQFLWIFHRYLLIFQNIFCYYNYQCKYLELYPKFDLLNEFCFFLSCITPQLQWLYIIYYYHYQCCSSLLLFFIDLSFIFCWSSSDKYWRLYLLSKESFISSFFIVLFIFNTFNGRLGKSIKWQRTLFEGETTNTLKIPLRKSIWLLIFILFVTIFFEQKIHQELSPADVLDLENIIE